MERNFLIEEFYSRVFRSGHETRLIQEYKRHRRLHRIHSVLERRESPGERTWAVNIERVLRSIRRRKTVIGSLLSIRHEVEEEMGIPATCHRNGG